MIIGVIGSGTMGSGIAQVAATAGCEVKLFDSSPDALKNSEAKLGGILNRLVEKGRINPDEKNAILSRITYVNSIKELKPSALVVEAIIEDLEAKQNLFSELQNHVAEEAVLATNTSSLSVSAIASALERPERCLGMHFFNPVPLMKLVELIPAIQTGESVLKEMSELLKSWGKTVAVAKDTPGFIVNRVARPFYGEALRIFEEGLASVQYIDESLKSLGGFRMGPFELMDFIGNDVNYAVTESVFQAFYNDPRYRPSFTQKRLVEAGYLGRKSRRGYYNYDAEGNLIRSEHIKVDRNLEKEIFDRVLVMLINEAADAVYLNIASAEDIDQAMTKGVNYPKGLLKWADERGIQWCVSKMDELYSCYHEDRYRCSPLLRRMMKEGKTFYS